MKKILFIIVLVVILYSCKSSKSSLVTQTEDDYVLAYKTSILYFCLNESTNGNFNDFCTDNNDLKLSAIDTYHINLEDVKSKGMGLSKKIRIIDYADYEGRKPIFSDCVQFAFSKEIDSIARDLYKRKGNYQINVTEK
jgi:hypothetical protein